ncbi:MAG TPA: DUF3455 domain-containing protein [Candidatus Angelobacter sp.]|nr:DUF3455 domain-containing protein [Candidatus Angelobacter sp.]
MAKGQGVSRPTVPDAIKAPAGEDVVLVARAAGAQIYTCTKGSDGAFSWTLKAPEADLRDDKGAVIGKHYAGPTWKLNDGSEVAGKAAARADAPEADGIPWLLLTVTANSGKGALAGVTTVQRIHTRGGQAPADGCAASSQGTEKRVSYTADYYFYAAKK